MHSAQPRVAIGLPVYNGEKYLAQTIDSIIAQTYGDFELVISDNASTDRTRDISRDYANRDGRIRYLRNDENRGAAWNYNRVFEITAGEYFKWAAHDDLMAPAYIEKCIEALDSEPGIVLSYPKTRIIDENGGVKEDYFDNLHLESGQAHERFRRILFDLTGECNAVFGLMRREALLSTKLIGSYHSSDIVLLAELAMRGRFHEVPEQLFFRRDHPDTSVRLHRSKQDRTAWFDPKKAERYPMPMWRWFFEFLGSVRRAPIGAAERSRCFALTVKWARVHNGSLRRELKEAVSHRLGR